MSAALGFRAVRAAFGPAFMTTLAARPIARTSLQPMRRAFSQHTRNTPRLAHPPILRPIQKPTPRAFSKATQSKPHSEPWQSLFRRASQRQQQHRQQRRWYRQPFNYRRFNQTTSLFRRWAARSSFYYEVGGIGVACGVFYILNLEEVPVSGRRRFNIMPAGFEEWMAKSMYEQTMQEFQGKILPPYSREHRLVQRVLDRLLPHATGLAGGAGWEIYVIDSPEKNAFVIPGGKVFVFSGILETCKNEDGLAAVLGHEIAHNVAHHASERAQQGSIGLILLIGLFILGIDPGFGQTISNLMFTLPHSRAQESEADYIGLLMMAESCYDPQGAVGLWTRMGQEEKNNPPQWMSTHPSSYNRLGKIKDWLPEAESKRESGECGATREYAQDFERITDTSRWHDFIGR